LIAALRAGYASAAVLRALISRILCEKDYVDNSLCSLFAAE